MRKSKVLSFVLVAALAVTFRFAESEATRSG